MSECQKNELLIENSCFPMKIPGENCIHNDQCLSYLFEPKYYCIDSLCQQKNLHNIPLIGIPETIMNTLSISPKRLSPPRFKKELMKPFAWIPELSFKPKIYKGQVCRGTYSRPQMMHGVVVECMSNPCAPNYECEYVHGGGRYICCSRKNIASSQMMSSLGLAALSKMPQNYGLALPSSLYSGIPSSISAGSGCVTKTCTTCTRECGCMQRSQNEYLCCPNQLVQPNLNFGFLQWTIAINLSPVPQDCLPPDFGYCYCPSVKIVASIIPIIPIVPTTTTTSPD
uniref:EB domain-containing protein n=1 Tax=Acrobeloides nanus TaxID=290746 RepID=A0A914CTB1_9BILA